MVLGSFGFGIGRSGGGAGVGVGVTATGKGVGIELLEQFELEAAVADVLPMEFPECIECGGVPQLLLTLLGVGATDSDSDLLTASFGSLTSSLRASANLVGTNSAFGAANATGRRKSAASSLLPIPESKSSKRLYRDGELLAELNSVKRGVC